MNERELKAMLDLLSVAPPCDRHDKQFLCVCPDCRASIWCSECERRCQCWNDD